MTTHIEVTEYLASKSLATPVSFVGGYRLIRPLAKGGGWLRGTGVGALILLWWLLVSLLFYVVIFGLPILALGWLVFTQARRHRIQAARLALASRSRQT
jgi:hypothetical protein